MAMPAGTPVTIATPTATLTIDRCSSVRSPIAGRLCRMNASVSTASPRIAMPLRAIAFGERGASGESVSNGYRLVKSRRVQGARGGRKRAIVSSSLRPPVADAMTASASQHPSLLQRLDQGPVICAEGYVFELERRGYLQAGAFVFAGVGGCPGGVARGDR